MVFALRSKNLLVLLSLALSLLAVPALAGEDRERLQLTYRAPDDASCPDEASFRNLVAARLGYDPFSPDSPGGVRVELARDRRMLRGRIEVDRPGDPAPNARALSGKEGDCEALVLALATTLAIALDPVRAATPTEKAQPSAAAPTPASTVLAPPAPAAAGGDAAPPASTARPIFFAALGGVVSVEGAPSVAIGGEAAFGLRTAGFSAEAAGRVESTPQATRVASGDRLQATILSGALIPCARLGAWAFCAVGRVGAFQGYAPDVASPHLGTTVFASVGARVGYSFALSRNLALRPTIEGALPVVRTSLAIAGVPVWTAGPATGGASLALVADLP
jgi:hypothetical protein